MNAPTLTTRALNRALLARQLLSKRSTLTPAAALDHLVGMQAQIPHSPYVGLWSRLAGFRPEQLADLIVTRQAVRTALMRNTLHLVTADDCLALRPVVQPLFARLYAKANPAKLAAMVAAGRAIVDEQPRTNAELGRLLRRQFPGYDAFTLGYAVRNHLALVQLPPRGVWGQSGVAMLTTAESWLGRPLARTLDPGDMLRRYLRAFGPASVADMSAWSGLAGLKDTIERMRSTLRTFRDERGRELFDLPDGLLPRTTSAAPVRFLPEYDNVLVAYDDRARLIPTEYRRRVTTDLGKAALLVDGFVRGSWRIERTRHVATLHLELFDAIARRARNAVEREGRQLLAFAAPDAVHIRIRR